MTEETPHLDIIVASSDVLNIARLIEGNISKLSKKIGFEYGLEFRSEGWFLGPTWKQHYETIAQNAVIVTHGGQYYNYRYFKAVKELSELRPDLRFIVRMEASKGLSDFGDEALFAFYQQLEKDFERMSEAHNAAYKSIGGSDALSGNEVLDDNNVLDDTNASHEKEISDEFSERFEIEYKESFKYDITKPIFITHQSLPFYLCKKSFSEYECYEPYFDSYLRSFVEHLRAKRQCSEKQESVNETAK